jgi:hypothetical protein
LVPAPIITPLPTTTTTTIYPIPTIYASASLAVCPVRACPAITCVSPAYQQTDMMADGCPGCPYCFTPLPVAVPVASTPVTVLPPIVCPTRTCPVMPICIPPAIRKVDTFANGCSGCPYCARPSAPCVGLYCLPCCPPIVTAGQACRNCLSFF